MARPRKPEAERRNRTIGVRVTTAEAAEIAERAGAARMTKGGYMRRRALAQPVREAAVHRLGAKERVELHRIGVNLNQIARALNSGASAPVGTREAVERVGELAAGLLTGEVLDR
ncbi:MAG: plasmid mobilization relaxosome protein MobC [Gammaproteobacteria bacterium]|nr:plasmid mobilization relaxosome protein MobC [Gammaproteobacteria bacterium]